MFRGRIRAFFWTIGSMLLVSTSLVVGSPTPTVWAVSSVTWTPSQSCGYASSYPVPAGAVGAEAVLVGGSGGNGAGMAGGEGGSGGLGAELYVSFPVSYGDTLTVVTGCQGTNGIASGSLSTDLLANSADGGAGWSAGGQGGFGAAPLGIGYGEAGGGGGSTGLCINSDSCISNVIAVAGGGGGGGEALCIGAPGGNGGDGAGSSDDFGLTGAGGQSGQSLIGSDENPGGAGGNNNNTNGGPTGGDGMDGNNDFAEFLPAGGGGGGGYVGGGGAGPNYLGTCHSGGGGGAGSSYVAPNATLLQATPAGVGDGSAVVVFTIASPPSATISSPPNNDTFVLGQTVSTSFSCSEGDQGPGLSSCTDNHGASSGVGNLDTSHIGTFTYSVTATSSDGLQGQASITYTVKSPPPTVTVSGPNQNGWMDNDPATVNLQAADPGGLAQVTYTVDGGTPTTVTVSGTSATVPVAVSGEGMHTVGYTVTTVDGVVTTGSTTFGIDTVPPVTSATVTPTPNAAGWNNTGVNVILSATDDRSGVAVTQYQLDGGAWETYQGPIPITAEGVHTVRYASTDKAGNQEAVKTLTVRIDETPPVTTAQLAGTLGTNGWFKAGTPVTLTLNASDALSGVALTQFTVNGGPSQTYSGPITFPDGQYTVTYRSEDVAGNWEAWHTLTFKVDQTPPTVTYSGNAGTYTVDQTVDITCTAADNLSGVASSTCQDIQGPAYSFGLGAHTFSATAVDNAGNTGSGSVTFDVIVTPQSLSNLTTRFVSKPGVAQSLVAKLVAAGDNMTAGQTNAADQQIEAYIHELEAQAGKSITVQQATLLIGLARALEP
jgi:methionine-rich copper-binding protein CopC